MQSQGGLQGRGDSCTGGARGAVFRGKEAGTPLLAFHVPSGSSQDGSDSDALGRAEPGVQEPCWDRGPEPSPVPPGPPRCPRCPLGAPELSRVLNRPRRARPRSPPRPAGTGHGCPATLRYSPAPSFSPPRSPHHFFFLFVVFFFLFCFLPFSLILPIFCISLFFFPPPFFSCIYFCCYYFSPFPTYFSRIFSCVFLINFFSVYLLLFFPRFPSFSFLFVSLSFSSLSYFPFSLSILSPFLSLPFSLPTISAALFFVSPSHTSHIPSRSLCPSLFFFHFPFPFSHRKPPRPERLEILATPR